MQAMDNQRCLVTSDDCRAVTLFEMKLCSSLQFGGKRCSEVMPSRRAMALCCSSVKGVHNTQASTSTTGHCEIIYKTAVHRVIECVWQELRADRDVVSKRRPQAKMSPSLSASIPPTTTTAIATTMALAMTTSTVASALARPIIVGS